MHIDDVRVLARTLMDQHGLQDLPLSFSRARTIAGRVSFVGTTYPRRKGQPIRFIKSTITMVEMVLSAPIFADFNEDTARDTILHEIAHALVGPNHGHDIVWKLKAREIGCNGDRCFTSADAPQATKGRWEGKCAAGHIRTAHRAPQRVRACGKCSSVFQVDNIIVWTKDGVEVPMHEKFIASMAKIRRSFTQAAAMYTENGARTSYTQAA